MPAHFIRRSCAVASLRFLSQPGCTRAVTAPSGRRRAMELYAYERRRWLVDQARQVGRIDVAEVAQALTVAKETVRRDLTALEAEGLLRRVHGGAVPVERLGFEGTLTLRHRSRPDEKGRIADYAVGLLGTAESIYIDEGSTPQAFAERLHPRRPLT